LNRQFIEQIIATEETEAIQYYSVLASNLNVKTGINDRQYNVINIQKAIILDIEKIRTFRYDLSFIAANKNFTFGGLFDVNTFVCIAMKEDFKSIVPKLDDHIMSRNIKYEVKSKRTIENAYEFVVNVADSASKEKFAFAQTRIELKGRTL
jgi:hypothetical protein